MIKTDKKKTEKQQKLDAVMEKINTIIWAILLKKLDKTPDQFNQWIDDLNHEKRHCVRLALIATKALIKGIAAEVKTMNNEILTAMNRQNQLIEVFKIARYDLINQMLKDLKDNHGNLKTNSNRLFKCDCLLN